MERLISLYRLSVLIGLLVNHRSKRDTAIFVSFVVSYFTFRFSLSFPLYGPTTCRHRTYLHPNSSYHTRLLTAQYSNRRLRSFLYIYYPKIFSSGFVVQDSWHDESNEIRTSSFKPLPPPRERFVLIENTHYSLNIDERKAY